MDMFGLRCCGTLPVLNVLNDMAEATVDDLALLTELTPGQIETTLRWAETLDIAEVASSDTWRLGPAVRRILAGVRRHESDLVAAPGA